MNRRIYWWMEIVECASANYHKEKALLNQCWCFMKRLDYFLPPCELVKLSKQSHWGLCSTSAFSLRVAAFPIYFSYAVYIFHFLHFSIICPGTVFIKEKFWEEMCLLLELTCDTIWFYVWVLMLKICKLYKEPCYAITEFQRGNQTFRTNMWMLKEVS